MNLYIRALGFDKLTSEAEEKFIKLEMDLLYVTRN